jgi:hypothetical protein
MAGTGTGNARSAITDPCLHFACERLPDAFIDERQDEADDRLPREQREEEPEWNAGSGADKVAPASHGKVIRRTRPAIDKLDPATDAQELQAIVDLGDMIKHRLHADG